MNFNESLTTDLTFNIISVRMYLALAIEFSELFITDPDLDTINMLSLSDSARIYNESEVEALEKKGEVIKRILELQKFHIGFTQENFMKICKYLTTRINFLEIHSYKRELSEEEIYRIIGNLASFSSHYTFFR